MYMSHAWPRDPEVPNGYQDADIEMRELEEAGNRAYRAIKKALYWYIKGDLEKAAATCPHGSLRPEEGKGYICNHCGSIVSDFGSRGHVIRACVHPFGCPKCDKPLARHQDGHVTCANHHSWNVRAIKSINISPEGGA